MASSFMSPYQSDPATTHSVQRVHRRDSTACLVYMQDIPGTAQLYGALQWCVMLNGALSVTNHVRSFRNDDTAGLGYKKRTMLIGKRREDIYTTETTKPHKEYHR